MEHTHVKLPDTANLQDLQAAPLIPSYTASLDRFINPTTTPPWRLRLQISGTKHTTLGIEVKEKVTLGRFDPDQPPDIDLNDYGGANWGVSRQHAQLVLERETLYIEDLGSTNHTCLNGFMLEAMRRYRLRDGDELRLGKLKILIRFIHAPSYSIQ